MLRKGVLRSIGISAILKSAFKTQIQLRFSPSKSSPLTHRDKILIFFIAILQGFFPSDKNLLSLIFTV